MTRRALIDAALYAVVAGACLVDLRMVAAWYG